MLFICLYKILVFSNKKWENSERRRKLKEKALQVSLGFAQLIRNERTPKGDGNFLDIRLSLNTSIMP